MPKASIQDVLDLGFSPVQFNGDGEFDTEDTGTVARLLADVSLEVRAEVGAATYDAADSAGTDTQKLHHKRLKDAERFLAAADLWRRIEGFERQMRVAGREGDGAETIGSRQLANADAYEARAWAELGRITGATREGGISVGYVESGPYAEVGS